MEASEAILQKVKNDALQRGSINQTNLYIDSEILLPGGMITAGQKKIPVQQNSIIVFVDDEPLRNWGHACRYFLYSAM